MENRKIVMSTFGVFRSITKSLNVFMRARNGGYTQNSNAIFEFNQADVTAAIFKA
jgi:hypothetical protein